MNCLCCGRPILHAEDEAKPSSGWHVSCAKHFFGAGKMPAIDLPYEFTQIADAYTKKGLTIPGIQKKLSLHYESGKEPRLTFVDYPAGFIMKPPTTEYEALPEAEYLVMRMAAETGIKTVPFALIRTQPDPAEFAYITKRIDRVISNDSKEPMQSLAMEDFCQLDGRLTEDKYRGSYERCARIISKFSMNPGLDLSEMFLRIVFSYVVGNADMHLKNFSLIETQAGSGDYVLSPAYDMLPTNVIIPDDPDQFALTLNGKKSNFRRVDFAALANTCGIPAKSAEKMMERIFRLRPTYLEMCRESYLPEGMKASLERLIEERVF